MTYAGEDHDARFATRHEAEWIVGMCAVLLCGPRTAAERVPWQSLRDFGRSTTARRRSCSCCGTARASGSLSSWTRPARSGLVPQGKDCNGQLSRALRAAAVHHGLPCPTGNTFLKAWYAGTPLMRKWQWQMDSGSEGLAAWLAVDPFMPELLLGYLAAGESG